MGVFDDILNSMKVENRYNTKTGKLEPLSGPKAAQNLLSKPTETPAEPSTPSMFSMENAKNALNMLNPTTDEDGNKLNSHEDVQDMAARLSTPKISGTPGPELPVPEIEPVSGAPLMNRGVLAKLGLPQPVAGDDASTQDMPPVANLGGPSKIPARKPAADAAIPMAGDIQEQGPSAIDKLKNLLVPSAYGEDLSDSAIQKAQGDREQNINAANASRFADIFTKGALPGYQGNDAILKDMVTQAQDDRGTKDLITRRSQKDLELKRVGLLQDLDDKKQLSDPNSSVSSVMRDQLFAIQPDLAKNPVYAKLSGEQINKFFPMVKAKLDNETRLQIASDNAEARKLQRDMLAGQNKEKNDQRNQEEQRRVNGSYNQFLQQAEKDPLFKDFQKRQDAFNRVGELTTAAEAGNQAAVAALGTQLARAMGEVGVLTDQDVKRYLGNSSYGRKLLSWQANGMQGKIPAVQAGEIRDVGQMFNKLNDMGVGKIYDRYATRFANSFPDAAPSEDDRLRIAYQRLGHPAFTKGTANAVSRLKKEVSGPYASTDSESNPGSPAKPTIGTGEVKRMTKDGKTAIFDAVTKKFLRYEE